MDIEELYRCVFNNVSKNQYDKAFEIALSAYQSYTLNELDEFFRKSPPVYNMVGISGSGGSNSQAKHWNVDGISFGKNISS